jgi:hypothetical protein
LIEKTTLKNPHNWPVTGTVFMGKSALIEPGLVFSEGSGDMIGSSLLIGFDGRSYPDNLK